MTTQEVSAGSTLDASVIRAAVATIPEVRQYEEYSGLTEDSAKSIVQDAVSTGHIFRTNGSTLADFPGYYGLRFIATADEDRGFFHASNSRKVRAACLKLYTLGYGKKEADPNAPKRATASRAPATKDQKRIVLEITGDWNADADTARMLVSNYYVEMQRIADEAKQNAVQEIVSNMDKDGLAAMIAELQKQLASK